MGYAKCPDFLRFSIKFALLTIIKTDSCIFNSLSDVYPMDLFIEVYYLEKMGFQHNYVSTKTITTSKLGINYNRLEFSVPLLWY